MQADYALRRVWTRYLAKNTKNMNCFLRRYSTPTLASECCAVELETTRSDCGRPTPAFKDSLSGSLHKCTPLRRIAEESPDKFLWTLFQSSVKHLLYTLAVKSWKRRGPHFDKDEWQGLGECILNYMYSCKWHPKLFQSHNTCALCLLRMWEPCKVSCHHEYHRECLVRWRSMGHDTCPLCQAKISQ
ncbi:hypothetical protein CEXT_649641 [Caerostris extrusa]|uniref:RING-type domain-containing protein n=1 Tax=Caerostris extrusa TaxID=172846 RepID=A0AAV4T8A5_CAEEX|nr:hypothetical protein CEXT_649641 [Caerostris extrusa]